MEVFDIEAEIEEYVFSAPAISITSMNVAEVTLPSQKLQNIQYLDIQASIGELFAEKQDNLTSASVIDVGSINGITATTLGYLDATSSIQTQINSKQPTVNNQTDLVVKSLNNISSATLGYIDPTSSIQTQLNSKQPTVDSNTDLVVKSLNNIPSTTLAYIDPTSSIQTQINSKQPTVDSNTDLVVKSLNNISSATLAYIDPTSSIQTQINSKQPTVNNQTDLVVKSLNNIPSATLAYIDPTSSIQTQINSKQPTVDSNTDLVVKSLNNISSATLAYIDPTSSIQSQLNGKSGLSSNNTYTGYNEFQTYAPTCPITCNSDYQIPNKKYVDDSIASLVSSAPSTLNTLNELATALGSDPNFSTTMTTELGTKAGLTANNTFSGNNTHSGQDVFSNTNTFNGNCIYNNVTLTPSQMSNIQYVDVSSSLTTQLANKQPSITSSVDVSMRNLTVGGTLSLPNNSVANSALQSSVVIASTAPTLTGTNFSGIPQSAITNLTIDLSGKQGTIDGTTNLTVNSLNSISSTTLGYLDATSSIQTQLNAKQATINGSTNLTVNSLNGISSTTLGYLDATSSIQTQLNAKQATINGSTNLTVNSLNGISSTTLGYLDATSSIQTQLNAKQGTISSSSNLTTGSVVATGLITAEDGICERFIGINATSSNVYTLNYTNGNCYFINTGQQPSANFSVNITNVPTTSTNQYTLSLVYNANFIPSLVSATDTASTTIYASSAPKWAGGTQPSVTSSALYIATFTIIPFTATKLVIASVQTFN